MDRRPSLAEGHSLGHRLFVISHPSAYLRRPELEASEISVLSLARRLGGIRCLWRHKQMNYRVLPRCSCRYTVSFRYDPFGRRIYKSSSSAQASSPTIATAFSPCENL